jgi:hypothetical protein
MRNVAVLATGFPFAYRTVRSGTGYAREATVKLKLWQVDAFAERVFGGNPAAVVPLQEWLPEHTMQAIASENQLSETAFFCRRDRVLSRCAGSRRP